MKRLFATATAIALVATLGACKQDAAPDTEIAAETAEGAGIDGTWVMNLDQAKFDGKPLDILLKDGTYSCANCTPPLTVAADGEFHALTGRDYSDAMSVKIDSDSAITTVTKRGDMQLGTVTSTVSADGKTLTRNYTDTSVENGKPVTGTDIMTRVGEAPAGAHAVSGKWKMTKIEKLSDEGMTATFTSTADTLKMVAPDGSSWEAKLDGTDTPIVGNVAGATISVTKTGDNAYRMVSKLRGKETSTGELMVEGDTLRFSQVDTRTGDKSSMTATRK